MPIRSACRAGLLAAVLNLAAAAAPMATGNRYGWDVSSGSLASATADVGRAANPVRRSAVAATFVAGGVLAAAALARLYRRS